MAEKKPQPVSGPSGVGKNSTIGVCIEEYDDMRGVVSITTREARMERGRMEIDGVHYYFRKDYDGIWRAVEAGEFFQIAVPKTGKAFYGSLPEDYPDDATALIDVSVEEALKLHDELAVTPVCILPPSMLALTSRLDARGSISPEARKDRLTEAVDSIGIGVKSGSPFQCIINDDLPVTARYLCEVARYGGYDDRLEEIARETGRFILRELSSDLGLPRTFGGFSFSLEQ